ncbi:MAG: coproporphyrinogen-III oxidase family protein [Candidatus Polarisedimenticolia bacterium]
MSTGVYAHIPFCARRCDYCDFFVIPGTLSPGDARGFFELLSLEARRTAGLAGAGTDADTLYLGGGTPSFVPPDEIARFVQECLNAFSIHPGAEISMEANPESVLEPTAAAWREAGVNRLSLGAQSFDDAVLAPRGRLHTAAGTVRAFEIARRAGFHNVGIDLIAGLPGESLQGFLAGIGRVLEMGPEHVSVYLLETEESGKLTPLSRALAEGRARTAPEGEVVAMYEGAVSLLSGAGYEHYEISNFARPGRASRHNLKYWLSTPWAGLGPSAHSFLAGRRRANPDDLASWARGVRDAGAPPVEDYTLDDAVGRAREALVMNLRLMGGVDLAEFSGRWGMDPDVDLAQTLEDLEQAGLLRRGAGRLALTPRGVLLSNEVFGRIS